MCGSYRLSRRKQLVDEYFGSVSEEEEWEPRYNIAPTQPVPVIRQNPKEPIRELSMMPLGAPPLIANPTTTVKWMVNVFQNVLDCIRHSPKCAAISVGISFLRSKHACWFYTSDIL
jgi:putative SOS response-associated peptidase YedK